MMPAREQINARLVECKDALFKYPLDIDALNGLYQLYWGLADLYYNHGDIDGHIDLLIDIAEVAREVSEHHHLEELQMRYVSYETLCGLGHQGMGLDTLYKMRKLGLYPHDKTTLVIAKWGENTNLHLMNYWRTLFDSAVESRGTIQFLAPMCGARGILGLLEDRFVVTRFVDGYRGYSEASAYVNSIWKHGPVLKLTDDDRQRGEDALRKMGIPSSAWFVTLHVRESRYQDFAQGRNVQVSDYLPAIGEIAAAGGWIIRIGSPDMTPLLPMPNVIDYAHSDLRADWLDVYLLAACRFFVGTQSGPAQIPPTFGVRSALTNWQMGFRPTYPTDTVIFRRYALDGKPLSIRESFASKLPYIESPSLYVPGVTTIPNTPEEIRELVQEMLNWPKGVNNIDWKGQQERLNLVRQYNALQQELTATLRHNPAGACPVGGAWLKEYGE